MRYHRVRWAQINCPSFHLSHPLSSINGFQKQSSRKRLVRLPNPQPDDPSSKLPCRTILNYKIKTIELQWSPAESFPESLAHGVISRLPVPGESVRDLRHLREIICDAHDDLEVEDSLVRQIDAQRDLIKVSHMQELDVIANSRSAKSSC